MLKKCMSILKNILKFNWIRDLLFASIVYTLMVSFSIVRMPLCQLLNIESCAIVNALVFRIVFYISYFFSLYALYLLIKFFAYVVYGIYRAVKHLTEKRTSSKATTKTVSSSTKSKKTVAKKSAKKTKTSKK